MKKIFILLLILSFIFANPGLILAAEEVLSEPIEPPSGEALISQSPSAEMPPIQPDETLPLIGAPEAIVTDFVAPEPEELTDVVFPDDLGQALEPVLDGLDEVLEGDLTAPGGFDELDDQGEGQ